MKKESFVFDIETGPLPLDEIISLKPEFSAPKNYTDPAKISEYIEKKDAEWYDQDYHALHPMTARVIAIGVMRSDDKKVWIIDDANEEALLNTWWTFWEEFKMHKFIGFHCNTFDVPFLKFRSWKHGVRVPMELNWTQRPWDLNDYFIDLQNCLSEFSKYGVKQNLDNVAKTLLGVGKTGSGKNFAEMAKFSYEDAVAYLKHDLELTHGVAGKVGAI